MRRRALSLWFVHLAAERILRARPDLDPTLPFAVTGRRKSALRLCALNRAAQGAGLSVGMSLADARAILPNLATSEEDLPRDADFLRAIGRWCGRYTPWRAEDGQDGLILDLTGCAHLHGGERLLVRDLSARLSARGLTLRWGLADTRGAAWALARYGTEGEIAAAQRTREAMTGLPVAALGITADTTTTLMRLGLERIGDLLKIPRASLARRFDAGLVQRLDRVLGAEPDPITPESFRAPYAVRLSLPEPIGHTDDVTEALARLLDRLCDRLARERRGARRLCLSIRRADGGGDSVTMTLGKASHDPERIAPQFTRGIAELDAGFGIDAVRLEALVTEPLRPEQANAFERGQEDDALADLIARIGNHIGFEHVIRFLPSESHIPERAFTPAAAAYSKPEPFPPSERQRPLMLIGPEAVNPVAEGKPLAAFTWRGARYETVHSAGPERIAPEWWLDDPAWRSGPRDYWWVQTAQGPRLWLYHAKGGETPGGWFLHGHFP